MKKTLSAIFAMTFLVVVVVSVFSVSALAVDSGYLVPVFNGSTPSASDCKFLFGYNAFPSSSDMVGCCTSSSAPIVYCTYIDSSNLKCAMFLSTQRDAVVRRPWFSVNGSTYTFSSEISVTLAGSALVDGATYYYQITSVNGASWVVDPTHFVSYSNASDIIDFLVDKLNYSPPSPDPDPPSPSPSLNDGGTNLSVGSAYPITVVVPAGYMLCVEGDLGNIRFDQSFDDYSALFQVSGFWWWGSSAFTRDSASVPVIGSSYNINPDGSSRLAFLKSEPKNFAGQSRNGYLLKEFNNAGDYLLIFNPQINWYNDHGLAQTNHDLIVTFRTLGGVDSIRAFPISSPTYSYLGDEYIDCTVTGDPYYLSLSGLWRDPTESSNLVSLPHAQNGDEQVSVLDGLVSDIDSLVSGLWSHIRTLSDLLGQFPDAIVSIYSWLPSDYRALLACLFGISCTIGVLKVLL